VQCFVGETCGKESTEETQTYKGSYIKMDIQEAGYGGMDWVELVRIETGGGHL
jgi:hypothetical protein